MKMRSISTLAALASFGAALVSAVGLSACGNPEMYCLATSGSYAATFLKTGGDDGCLPPEGEIFLDHYLASKSVDGDIADPGKPSLAFTLKSARSALDAGISHMEALKRYESCQKKDTSVDTNPDKAFIDSKFYSFGKFDAGKPDGVTCTVSSFDPADLVIAEMPGAPACDDGQVKTEKLEPFSAKAFKYSAKNINIEVSPAIKGLYAFGELDYEGLKADGTACKASYRFEAVNPASSCKTDQECKEFQTGKPKTADSPAKAPTILVPDPLRCAGYKPPSKPDADDEVMGLCVVNRG